MNTDPERKLASWEASFRSAAQADGNAVLAEHLRRFDLQVEPELLLEGTIDFVIATVALAAMPDQKQNSGGAQRVGHHNTLEDELWRRKQSRRQRIGAKRPCTAFAR